MKSKNQQSPENEALNPLLTCFQDSIDEEESIEYTMREVNSNSPSPSERKVKIKKHTSLLSEIAEDRTNLGSSKSFEICRQGKTSNSNIKVEADLLNSIEIHSSQNLGYDPIRVPPFLNILEKHIKATKVGLIKRPLSHNDLCPCCNFPINKEEIGLLCSGKDLTFLGTGYPLYFEMLSQGAFALLVVFFISGIYSLITTYDLCLSRTSQEAKKQNNECHGYLGLLYSTKVPKGSYFMLNLLNTMSVVILSCFIMKLKMQVKSFYENEKNTPVRPSDFTIWMRNVPSKTTEQEIKNFLSLHAFPGSNEVNLEIRNVIFTYRILDFVKLIREKQYMQIQKEKALNNKRQKDEWERLINDIEEKISILNKDLEKKPMLRSSSMVFVTFNRKHICENVIKAWEVSRLKRFWLQAKMMLKLRLHGKDLNFEKNCVIIQRTPEPMEIIWENLGIEPITKILRRGFTYLITSLLIVISFMIILFLTKLKENYKKDNTSSIPSLFFTLLCSTTIFIINNLLTLFIVYFSKFELYPSQTAIEISRAIKLTVMQFINMCLVPFSLFIYYKQTFTQLSLLQNIFFIFVFNILLEPFMEFNDIGYFYCLYRRYRLRNDNNKKSKLTHLEATQYFESPSPRMAHRYAALGRTLLAAAFFSSIFPINLIISSFALIASYWCDKYLLLRRYGCKIILSEKISKAIFLFFELVPLTCSIGNLFYNKFMIETDSYLICYSNIVISLIFLAYCWTRTESAIFYQENKSFEDHKSYKTTYEREKKYFISDYDRMNPVTEFQATAAWSKLIEESSDIEPERKNLLRSTINLEGIHQKFHHHHHQQANKIYKSIENYALFGFNIENRNFNPKTPKNLLNRHSLILSQPFTGNYFQN